MRITINGRSEKISGVLNLSEIVTKKGFCADNIVIEHNKLIVPRSGWDKVIINENDMIEIVSFVAGG